MMMGLLLVLSNSYKKDEDNNSTETGTVTDIDGNIYKTVKIDQHWWMAENIGRARIQALPTQAALQPSLVASVGMVVPSNRWAVMDSGGQLRRALTVTQLCTV
jgi:hypothetical protein